MTNSRFVRLQLECLEERELLSAYFVSPLGDDGFDGSSDNPWLTLQYAADQVRAGDTVSVRAGDYQGFELTTDGAADARIVFSAESGVTINDANPVRGYHGINLEGADYVTIEGFKVVGMDRAGIRSVENSNVIIRNNVADQNGLWGIFSGFSEDLLIEGNTASNSVNEHGIYVSNSADRPIIRNNTVYGNYASGIQINADVEAGGDGIITGALVEGNTIYDNGLLGGAALNFDGLQDSIIRNNLLYNNHASGIVLYKGNSAEGSTGNVVVNNTIVMADDARWAFWIQYASTGNKLLNNIIYNNNSATGGINISLDSLTDFVSDYNIVMNRFTTDDAASVLTLAVWQTATGQDLHSDVATPAELFVDPDANDYHLKAGSLAIDAGTSSNAPSKDILGKSRPSGNGYDIGAYEFQSEG